MYDSIYEFIVRVIYFFKGIRRVHLVRSLTDFALSFVLFGLSLPIYRSGVDIAERELEHPSPVWPVAFTGTVVQVVGVLAAFAAIYLLSGGLRWLPAGIVQLYRLWHSKPLWRERQMALN